MKIQEMKMAYINLQIIKIIIWKIKIFWYLMLLKESIL